MKLLASRHAVGPLRRGDADAQNSTLNQAYTYSTAASNVHAYIIDTGIRTTHTDFGARAVSGFDAIDGGAADDCNGHGTHVAGTVGGSSYGVAKGVQLVAVRVLDCEGSGTTAQVVAGIDWVTANAVKPAVANMSLTAITVSAVDSADRKPSWANRGPGARGDRQQRDDRRGHQPRHRLPEPPALHGSLLRG